MCTGGSDKKRTSSGGTTSGGSAIQRGTSGDTSDIEKVLEGVIFGSDEGGWVDRNGHHRGPSTPVKGKAKPKDDPIAAALKLLPPTPELPPTLSTRLETLKLFGVGMGEQGKRTTITDLKIGL